MPEFINYNLISKEKLIIICMYIFRIPSIEFIFFHFIGVLGFWGFGGFRGFEGHSSLLSRPVASPGCKGFGNPECN